MLKNRTKDCFLLLCMLFSCQVSKAVNISELRGALCECGEASMISLLKQVSLDEIAGLVAHEMLLHYAVNCGLGSVVSYLLIDCNVNVEIRSGKGLTPLHIAAQNGHIGLVRLLLEKGAIVNAETPEGLTALFFAAENGHDEVVCLLLQNRAIIDIKDNNCALPLHVATAGGYEVVTNLLLQCNADVNVQDCQNITSLHLAASGGYESIVRSLLQHRADVSAHTRTGRTPLDVACGDQIIDLLREANGWCT